LRQPTLHTIAGELKKEASRSQIALELAGKMDVVSIEQNLWNTRPKQRKVAERNECVDVFAYDVRAKARLLPPHPPDRIACRHSVELDSLSGQQAIFREMLRRDKRQEFMAGAPSGKARQHVAQISYSSACRRRESVEENCRHLCAFAPCAFAFNSSSRKRQF
jgi:hypothetical protein